MKQRQMVVSRREANLHRSRGVIICWNYLSSTCSLITFMMSSSTRMHLSPLFIFPMRFSALRVFYTLFRSRNWGVYSIYITTKNINTMLGMTSKIRTTSFQLWMKTKLVVTQQAPIANHGCRMTEYFCRVLSSTTSPRKLKHMLIAASAPAPSRNNPIATVTKFWLNRITRFPIVAIPQASMRVILLPKLSE